MQGELQDAARICVRNLAERAAIYSQRSIRISELGMVKRVEGIHSQFNVLLSLTEPEVL
jgi:hypothetical protein